jgi:anti-anti-sigma factor
MSVWAELEYERIVPENPRTVLYRLSGALTGSKACYAFLDAIRGDIAAGLTTVAINLNRVERINSSGVGILCTCFTTLRNADGRLIVIGVSERNQETLKAVGVWAVIDHFASEADVTSH